MGFHMQRLNSRTKGQQVDYHLADGRAPIFDESGQAFRTAKARELVTRIIDELGLGSGMMIVELGAGSADISGPFSNTAYVLATDITEEAERIAQERFPNINFLRIDVEEMEPLACDVLILTELLEHLYDPIGLVERWGPLARSMVIGHPLNEPNPPYEEGHMWSYTKEDFLNWFSLAGHTIREAGGFNMGPYDEMAIGYGVRREDL